VAKCSTAALVSDLRKKLPANASMISRGGVNCAPRSRPPPPKWLRFMPESSRRLGS
jgi:hypothetical protein